MRALCSVASGYHWGHAALVLLLAILSPTEAVRVEAGEGHFVDKIYRDATGEHKYVVFEPANYSPDRPCPVIFYLHGASGRGTDGRAQLIVGLGPALKARAATTPFLTVFAQNENFNSRLLGGWHDETTELDRALKILEEVERTYSVNKDHRVLVGVSMGAFGAWSLAAKNPHHWKAVLPVSGGGRLEDVPSLAKVPVWAFHAADDTLVPPIESTQLIDGINAAGGHGYVSILPYGGHNIGSHVFAQDEVFDWMLHPERPAQTNIDWATRPSVGVLMDELRFVPGAEVERAIQIRVHKDLLESLSYLLPEQIPAESMSGWKPGTSETRRNGFMSFDVSTGGLHHTGMIERAWLEPLAGNRLRLQMGLRHMTMTVPSTRIHGRLLNADASAMQIIVGHVEPVWLTAEVTPRVENRRIRFDLVSVDFNIPAHNWTVRGPADVRVRPLPFLEDRIEQQLIDGLASRKSQIEAEIRSSVPRLLTQVEDRVAKMTDRTFTYARFPMPLWQPRFKFYPESFTVEPEGLTLHLGATVAAIAPRTNSVPIISIPVGDEVAPTTAGRGLEVALSPRVITAWSTLLAKSDVARFHVLDMNSPQFRELGKRSFWERTIPALKDLPADAELETEFALRKPLQLSTPPQSGQGSVVGLEIPSLQIQLGVRRQRAATVEPLAEFDLAITQPLELGLEKPSFTHRQLKMTIAAGTTPRVTPRWLGQPANAELHPETIAKQFGEGWNEMFASLGRENRLNDIQRNGMALRWEQLAWTGHHFSVRLDRPGIRVRNTTAADVEYHVRSTGSPWSSKLKLAPGEFHEFRPPTALIWQSSSANGPAAFTLPLGVEANIHENASLRLTEAFQSTVR